jgi:Bacterial PH domain
LTVASAQVTGQIPATGDGAASPTAGEWEDGGVSSKAPGRSDRSTPVVIRLSPIAHFAVGFLALGLLAVVMSSPVWVAPTLVIPVVLSLAIVRLRTVADRRRVTARTLLGSRSVAWEDIKGLRFDRGSWAVAELVDGGRLRLPAVTLATVPLLATASGGRVPNPYA